MTPLNYYGRIYSNQTQDVRYHLELNRVSYRIFCLGGKIDSAHSALENFADHTHNFVATY